MTILQLFWVRPWPLDTNELPHFSPELSLPYFITPTRPVDLLKEKIVCKECRLVERKTLLQDFEAQTESSVAQDHSSEGSAVHWGVVVVVAAAAAVSAGSPAVCS